MGSLVVTALVTIDITNLGKNMISAVTTRFENTVPVMDLPIMIQADMRSARAKQPAM